MWVYWYTFTCMWQRSISGIPQALFTLFFGILFCFVVLKQCLFTDSQLSTKLSWLVNEPKRMPVTTSKMLGLHPACILSVFENEIHIVMLVWQPLYWTISQTLDLMALLSVNLVMLNSACWLTFPHLLACFQLGWPKESTLLSVENRRAVANL